MRGRGWCERRVAKRSGAYATPIANTERERERKGGGSGGSYTHLELFEIPQVGRSHHVDHAVVLLEIVLHRRTGEN